MRTNKLLTLIVGVMSLTILSTSQATVITFDDITLGNAGAGFSYTDIGTGFTLDAAASNGGMLDTISGGTFAGLHIPGFNSTAFGTYTFSFSSTITAIEIEFDALSNTGTGDPETITAFMTDAGAILINYTDQAGTSFDGTTITSTANDGQGIIDFSGPAFSMFSFDHAQNPSQNGFVIERITITTANGTPVPEPATLLLFAIGLIGLSARGYLTK